MAGFAHDINGKVQMLQSGVPMTRLIVTPWRKDNVRLYPATMSNKPAALRHDGPKSLEIQNWHHMTVEDLYQSTSMENIWLNVVADIDDGAERVYKYYHDVESDEDDDG